MRTKPSIARGAGHEGGRQCDRRRDSDGSPGLSGAVMLTAPDGSAHRQSCPPADKRYCEPAPAKPLRARLGSTGSPEGQRTGSSMTEDGAIRPRATAGWRMTLLAALVIVGSTTA